MKRKKEFADRLLQGEFYRHLMVYTAGKLSSIDAELNKRQTQDKVYNETERIRKRLRHCIT